MQSGDKWCKFSAGGFFSRHRTKCRSAPQNTFSGKRERQKWDGLTGRRLTFGNEYYKIMLMAQGLQLAIHGLRQRFGALLREQIVQTFSSESEVDEKLR